MRYPTIAVAVPTWKRGNMFRDCVTSLLSQDYKGHIEVMCIIDHEDEQDLGPDHLENTDLGIALTMQGEALADKWAGMRSIRIKRGPGRSNWRPGAIHFPVFEHWIQTKCELVTYQFSDEMSGPSRFSSQVISMLDTKAQWSYLTHVNVINGAGQNTGYRGYGFDRGRIPCNQLMTPSIIVNKAAFELEGGLDYPLHTAAKAEEWIQTHCALTGSPVGIDGSGLYYFREHDASLGHGQKPGSPTYYNSVLQTGWVEEDHWRLWNHIAGIYAKRVERARSR